MSKKWIIAIVVCVVVGTIACAGMGALRWGEMVYRLSDGERGWSVGVAVYQLFGWDAEAYEEDFGQMRWRGDDAEEAGECAETQALVWHHRGRHIGGRIRHRGGPRFLIGLACVTFLGLLLAVPGVIVYRRWRDGRDATSASDNASDPGDTE